MSDFNRDFNLDNNTMGNCPNFQNLQSISEYQLEVKSANGSQCAPIEILTEFLSSLMLKEYDKALKYCISILSYEPGNKTAREFYPLLLEKLKLSASEEENSLSESTETSSTDSSDSSMDPSDN